MQVDIPILEVFDPHPKQLQFLLAQQRYALALTGIGFGKTWALTLKALLAAVANVRCETALGGRTYRDLRDVVTPLLEQHVQTIQDATGVCLIRRWDKSDNAIHLLGGGKLLMRSYDLIDKWRGLNLAAAYLDEVEWASADATNVFGVVNERVRVQAPVHQLAFATSPNGLLGVSRIFWEAQQRGDADYHVTHGTTLDNPRLSPSFVRSLKASMSERRWQQEVEGKVLRPTHVVFPEATDDLLIDWNWRQNGKLPWVLAVDWGTGGHHVALMCQVLESGVWIVADELLCDDMPRGHFRWELQKWIEGGTSHKQGVVYQGKGWPVAAGCDRAAPTENQWLMGWLGTKGCYVRVCDQAQEQYITNGIEMLRDMMSPAEGIPRLRVAASLRKPHVQDTAGIWQALTTYRYHQDRDGNPTARPYKDDVTDHALDSLRYAIVTTRHDPQLHGGQPLSMVGLGPDGAHPEGGHSKHKPHW